MRYWTALLLAVALVAMPAPALAVDGIKYEGPFNTHMNRNVVVVGGTVSGPTKDPPTSFFVKHVGTDPIDAVIGYSFPPYTDGVWRVELAGGSVPTDVWFLPSTSQHEIAPGVWLVSSYNVSGSTLLEIRIRTSFAGVLEIRRVEFYLDGTPPEPPGGLAYTPGVGTIRLDWLASPEPDVKGYRVYVDGALVADVQSPGYTLDAPEYRAYEVAVTAYDASGNESEPSTITAYPDDPNAPVSPPGPPRNLLARPGPRSVILEWSPPAEGAESYRVSRDGEYLGETTGTRWEDRGVSPNRTYSYAVVAVNAAGDSPPATVMVHTPDAGPLDGVESHLGGLPGAVLSGLGLFSPIAWVAAALILAHVILTRGLQMIAGRRRA